MTGQYSTVQKLSLAGMVVGGLMCLVGAGSPYWLVSDPQDESGLSQLVSKVVKYYIGLFMTCIEVLGQEKCEFSEVDNDSGWFHVARMSALLCVLLGVLCGLISLCLACCTCCKHFIVVGILAFFAAAAGATCAITFAKDMDAFTTSIMNYKLASFGWGLYLFSGGVAVLGIVSFTACFSAPENPMRGMILSHPAIMVRAGNQNPYLNLQEQHEVNVVNTPANPGVTVVTTNGY